MCMLICQNMNIEKNKATNIVAIAFSVIAFFIVSGTYMFHLLEDWTWTQAFYFSVVTFTTVGYGDLVPTRDLTRLFTAIYILFSVGITVSALGVLGQNYLTHQLKRKEKKGEKK